MSHQKKVEYFCDWSAGVSGVTKGGQRDTKNDFAIKIVAFVEAGNSTGYLASVKREHDGETRYALINRGRHPYIPEIAKH